MRIQSVGRLALAFTLVLCFVGAGFAQDDGTGPKLVLRDFEDGKTVGVNSMHGQPVAAAAEAAHAGKFGLAWRADGGRKSRASRIEIASPHKDLSRYAGLQFWIKAPTRLTGGRICFRFSDTKKRYGSAVGFKNAADEWTHVRLDISHLKRTDVMRLLVYLPSLDKQETPKTILLDSIELTERAPEKAAEAAPGKLKAGPPRTKAPEGPPLVLEGDRLKIAFSSRDYHVVSFAGRDDFGEIAAPGQTGGNPLWRIVMMSNRGRPEQGRTERKFRSQWHASMTGYGRRITVDASADCRLSHEIERIAGGVRARLHWKGLDVGAEKGVLDVVATVRIPNGSDLAHWTLEMKNRSKVYGIWEYVYPVVEIAPPDPDLEANFFLDTYRMGGIARDPFRANPGPGVEKLSRWGGGSYVTHNTKAGQFTALYGANGRGFFYSSRDGEGWQKRFGYRFFPKQPSARIEMMHAPLNLGVPGEDFAMPYPVVAGFFKGDWYDACQLYRSWAIKQVWCRKGPLAQRKDIPAWLKDAPMVLRQSASRHMINPRDGEAPEIRTTVGQTSDNFLRCLDVFGKGLLSVWYEWHTVDRSRAGGPLRQAVSHGNIGQFITAAPGVAEGNRAAVRAGGYPMAYILAGSYDGGDPEDFPKARHAIMRDLKGEFHGGPGAWSSMCLSAEWFQKRFAEKCRQAIEESGFKGVYWDTFGSPLPRCFADNHGHSYGGGPQGVEGARRFAGVVRAAMKAADPEAYTSAEGSSEEFVDLVDTRLCAMILREGVAPIYSAIYHDYQLFFGRRIMPSDGEPIFSMIAGYTFNIGGQFGRYFITGKGIQADNPESAGGYAFLKKLIDAKRSATEFLNVGRMMRPPRILSDLPTLTGQHWYKKRMLTLPAVLSSAWKSPSGEIALVFVNCSPELMEFAYEIDTVEYGFPKGTKIARRLRKPDCQADAGNS